MNSFVTDPRVGAGVAGGTGLMGFLTRIGVTPELLGMVATLIGIILSLVIITVHVNKLMIDRRERRLVDEKLRLEIAQLKWRMEQDKKLAESRNNDPAA